MSTIIKCSSAKGKRMLSYDECVYTLEGKADAKMIFRYQHRGCKGTL